MLDAFRLYRELAPLRYITRFVQYPCTQPISVAEHSYFCGLLVGVFCTELTRRGVKVDRTRAIELALWHDVPEAITGDVPHPVLRQWPAIQAAVTGAEQDILLKLTELVGPVPYAGDEDEGLEAVLVKVADWFEAVLYIEEEFRAGNKVLRYPHRRLLALLHEKMRARLGKFGSEVAVWYDDVLNTPLNDDPNMPRLAHGWYQE